MEGEERETEGKARERERRVHVSEWYANMHGQASCVFTANTGVRGSLHPTSLVPTPSALPISLMV